MPEPVITIITGVSAVVTTVWRISQNLYELIEGINNAPKHIRAISEDVRGLYETLGALQGLLHNLDADRVPPALVPIFQSLQNNLDNCLTAFLEIESKINRYTKPSGEIKGSKWVGFRWQFTEKDTREFRGHLAAYKMTVSIALATANLANTSQNLNATRNIEADIEEMKVHLEEIVENNDEIIGSVDGDHGSSITQLTDRHYTLRKFLATTESIFSGSPPGSPTLSESKVEGQSPAAFAPSEPQDYTIEPTLNSEQASPNVPLRYEPLGKINSTRKPSANDTSRSDGFQSETGLGKRKASLDQEQGIAKRGDFGSTDVQRLEATSQQAPSTLSDIRSKKSKTGYPLPLRPRSPVREIQGDHTPQQVVPPPTISPSESLMSAGTSDKGSLKPLSTSAEDLADLFYEYFPISLDDWIPPVDAIYRPHLLHHLVDPPEIRAIQTKNKTRRYFSKEEEK